jgi:hypothetical protein
MQVCLYSYLFVPNFALLVPALITSHTDNHKRVLPQGFFSFSIPRCLVWQKKIRFGELYLFPFLGEMEDILHTAR